MIFVGLCATGTEEDTAHHLLAEFDRAAHTAEMSGKPPATVPLLSDVHLKCNEKLTQGAVGSAPHNNSATIEVYEPSVALTGKSMDDQSGEKGEISRLVHLVSLLVNILLFGAKLWVYIQSQSMVVLAALIDSTVDLLAQGILLLTNRMSTEAREGEAQILYPAGRSRAEPIGVIACALLMAMASAQVIRDSSLVLWEWQTQGKIRLLEIDLLDEGLLAMTTFLKFILYIYCRAMAERTGNVTVEAVSQDHMNDVLSNSAALAAAAATQITPALWLADPCGAIVISIYIVCRRPRAHVHAFSSSRAHAFARAHTHTRTHARTRTRTRTRTRRRTLEGACNLAMSPEVCNCRHNALAASTLCVPAAHIVGRRF